MARGGITGPAVRKAGPAGCAGPETPEIRPRPTPREKARTPATATGPPGADLTLGGHRGAHDPLGAAAVRGTHRVRGVRAPAYPGVSAGPPRRRAPTHRPFAGTP
ncbi:hypothetical protein GCM10010252_41820 [Streptomyces aureoverticillatus]|nr:hypothetical protein GCM10010252_41820 [Streptomyces aureoverticillatus]